MSGEERRVCVSEARVGGCDMVMLKYIKEFLYMFSAMTVLFAAAMGVIVLFFAPWGLGIYMVDVMGCAMPIVFGVIASYYIVLYCFARYFGLIEEGV